MPSRISLPKLTLFSSRHSPSSQAPASGSPPPPPPPPTPTPTRLSRGSSPSSTPTSPPARLHLRNILPSSPDEPPIMPPPPRTPRAWVWQCHRCLAVYRLGCTRRCLDCSHVYCVSGGSSSSSSSSPRGKKRRRADSGLCGAEFDYVGWEQWGSWRRKVLGYEALGRSAPAARDRAFLRKQHDCWIDCDSPSECCHRRYELATELMRAQKFAAEETTSQPPVILGSPPTSPDDDITFDGALALERIEEGEEDKNLNSGGTREEERGPKSPKSPKSPLAQSSFLWDDDDDDDGETNKKKTKEEEEEEVWWAARSSFANDEENDGAETHVWSTVIGDKDDDSGRPAKRLTVRNLTGGDVADDSDSDSESTGSGWSFHSSESDDSSVVEAGIDDGKPS